MEPSVGYLTGYEYLLRHATPPYPGPNLALLASGAVRSAGCRRYADTRPRPGSPRAPLPRTPSLHLRRSLPSRSIAGKARDIEGLVAAQPEGFSALALRVL